MTVIPCEQRSAEWRAARAGLLTASDAAAMLSKGKKSGEEAAGKTALRLRLALESLRGVPLEEDHFESDYMRRGRDREADGVGAYEAATGEIVQPIGFIRHDTLPVGCSPDGIIGDFAGGLELKSPKYTTHYEYLMGGRLPPEYVAQVMHSLFVTGLPWWDFCSYCPEFGEGPNRLFSVRVWPDGFDLTAYELAVRLFLSEVDHLKDTLLARCAPELTHA
jgi:predicted phage-related endonuclease